MDLHEVVFAEALVLFVRQTFDDGVLPLAQSVKKRVDLPFSSVDSIQKTN